MKRFAVAALMSLAQLPVPGAQAAEAVSIGQTGTDEVTIAFQHDGQTMYLRRHIDRSRWQFRTCEAQMAAAGPAGNTASVWQSGARNGVAIAQSGRADLALTTQNGIGNTALTGQTGRHDFASVSQQGTNWKASVGQSGACDIAIAVQMNAALPVGTNVFKAPQYTAPQLRPSRWSGDFAPRTFARP